MLSVRACFGPKRRAAGEGYVVPPRQTTRPVAVATGKSAGTAGLEETGGGGSVGVPRRSLRFLRLGRRGVMAMEFGLLAPMMIMVLLAGSDLITTMRAQTRVETVATQLGHIASQCQTITSPGDTTLIFEHGQRLMGNFGTVTGMTTSGAIIITAVHRVDNTNRIAWQVRTGSGTFVSSVGSSTRGSAATIDQGYVVPAGQTLIVTEIFLNRNSWALSSTLMRGAGLQTVESTKLFLTRAHNAAAVSNVPANSTNLSCFAS